MKCFKLIAEVRNRYERKTAGLLIACLVAGCSQGPGWEDATGQGRGEKELRADVIACMDQEEPLSAVLDTAKLNSNERDEAHRQMTERTENCIRLRGWRKR